MRTQEQNHQSKGAIFVLQINVTQSRCCNALPIQPTEELERCPKLQEQSLDHDEVPWSGSVSTPDQSRVEVCKGEVKGRIDKAFKMC